MACRAVPGLRAGCAAAHSADGRYLAFAPTDSGGLTLFDLRQGRNVAAFQMPVLGRLAWSPKGERIFCVGAADSACWVVDRATGSALRLPVRGRIPGGLPRWDSENEIRFFRSARQVGSLDLDSLRSRFLPGSATDPADAALAGSSIARTESCLLSIRPAVRTLVSPLESDDGTWQFDSVPVLCVVDKASNRSFVLLDRPVEQGTTLLVSPDASSVTVVDGGGALTYYAGLADEPPLQDLDAQLPPLPYHPPDSRLASLAETGRIVAYICAPLSNPLSGKVIGPDPREVRALACCGGWGRESGELTVVESYSPVRPGDVAAYLHHWEEGQPSLLWGEKIDDWWAEVRQLPASEAVRNAPSLPWRQAELATTAGGIEFRGLRADQAAARHVQVADIRRLAAGPPRTPPAARPPASRPADAGPPPPTGSGSPREETAEAIRAFVTRHHGKVGLGDLDGFVADYAGAVDLNDKGQVDSEFIRRDQAAYLPKYDRLSETIAGPIEVEPDGTGWRARYAIRSFAVGRRDGKEHDRRVGITLDIRRDGSGAYKIHRERAGAPN